MYYSANFVLLNTLCHMFVFIANIRDQLYRSRFRSINSESVNKDYVNTNREN